MPDNTDVVLVDAEMEKNIKETIKKLRRAKEYLDDAEALLTIARPDFSATLSSVSTANDFLTTAPDSAVACLGVCCFLEPLVYGETPEEPECDS